MLQWWLSWPVQSERFALCLQVAGLARRVADGGASGLQRQAWRRAGDLQPSSPGRQVLPYPMMHASFPALL